MTYDQLSGQNKEYFGYLEELTLQISYCKERGFTQQVQQLEGRKNMVKGLIAINLDKIEEIWNCAEIKYRPAERKPYLLVPEADKQKVIDLLAVNPNQSIGQVAALSGFTVTKTTAIITEYINTYKTPVSA